ncbi:hypothetical protein [Streptomyces rubiginosohelvolus]|uniref:Uncharacterized protein n=1 Tax=Streptomyces rubiginosohelvolus TaxID=67362 RepID=A0ABQ3BSS3_9ACTN|nr:hypothetical protein [Streptomyces pluricolorescens]GGZ53243.1 hypothetical protein GCM10010328_30070 [Streptomyces pluricolorescens]
MARVQILTAIGGLGFSWQPGQVIDLPDEQAALWADGVRAKRVDDRTPPPPGGVQGDDTSKPQEPDDPFDPDSHSNREVLNYLVDVGEEEALRVLDKEAAGQDRAGIAKNREAVLTQARANDTAAAEAEEATTDDVIAELAADSSRGGGRGDAPETR